jgi:lysozyme
VIDSWRAIACGLVEDAEGCVLKAYADPEPGGTLWTIGFGATGPDIGPDTVWTHEQADADLSNRVDGLNAFVTQSVRVRLTQQQRAALVDFAYNVGREAFAQSTLLRKLNAGDYDGAADEFLRWDKDDGKVETGLRIRRAVERALFKWGGA